MSKIVKLQRNNSRKEQSSNDAWEPDESFHGKLSNLIVRGRHRLFEPVVPEITDKWIEQHYEEIMLYFSQGHSQKVVAAVMGVPWAEWDDAARSSATFAALNQLGAQAQLLFFEELRNQSGRGTFKGNVGVTLHALDRQFADTYWGKAGIAAPRVAEEEINLEQAAQTLESYGLDPNELELGD